MLLPTHRHPTKHAYPPTCEHTLICRCIKFTDVTHLRAPNKTHLPTRTTARTSNSLVFMVLPTQEHPTKPACPPTCTLEQLHAHQIHWYLWCNPLTDTKTKPACPPTCTPEQLHAHQIHWYFWRYPLTDTQQNPPAHPPAHPNNCTHIKFTGIIDVTHSQTPKQNPPAHPHLQAHPVP